MFIPETTVPRYYLKDLRSRLWIMDKADEDHKAFTKAYTHQNYTSQVLKTLGLCSGARNGVWCKMINHGLNHFKFFG